MLFIKKTSDKIISKIEINNCYFCQRFNEKYSSIIKNELVNIKNEYDISKRLYIIINSIVSYDMNMIYYKNSLGDYLHSKNNDVLIEKNIIDCRVWSTIYSYYLNMYDVESYIVSYDNYHMNVKIIIDKNEYIVDGTNFKIVDGTYMSDISRAQYRLKPYYLFNLEVEHLEQTNCFNYHFTDLPLFLDNELKLKSIDINNIENVLSFIMETEILLSNGRDTTTLEKYSIYKNILFFIKEKFDLLDYLNISCNLFKVEEDDYHEIVPCFYNKSILSTKNSIRNLLLGSEDEHWSYDYYLLDEGDLVKLNIDTINSFILSSDYFIASSKNNMRK